jgi:hypothetical protein
LRPQRKVAFSEAGCRKCNPAPGAWVIRGEEHG